VARRVESGVAPRPFPCKCRKSGSPQRSSSTRAPGPADVAKDLLKESRRASSSCFSRSFRSSAACQHASRSEVRLEQHLALGPSCCCASCCDRHQLVIRLAPLQTQTVQSLTRFLQEQRPPSKDTALTPAHAIPKIVECDLLRAFRPRKTWLWHTSLTVKSRHWHTGGTGQGKTGVALKVWLVAKDPAPSGTRRRRGHLHGEVAARKDRVRLAIRVRHLLHLHRIERDTYPHSRSPLGVIHQDKLAALRFR
jgi:hypothetical protein